MENRGYGSAGASRTRRATKGFRAISGSPRDDIDYNNYTLRQRGRLMYMGNSVAASAIKTHRTNTIGVGLKPNPRPDAEFLRMSDEQAAQWTDRVKREFALWADRKSSCDMTGVNNFYEMQQLLLTSWLATGDVFVLAGQAQKTFREPYTLRLKAIEGDRVATPDTGLYSLTTGKNKENGNKIYDGVEINPDGSIEAYWIRNTHPNEISDEITKYTRVKAKGEKTGLANVLHIMCTERPEQYRGVSFIAPVIIPLLQLNRYTEAELTAAIIGSALSAFITTSEDTREIPINEASPEGDDEDSERNDYAIGPGTINFMKPGEGVQAIEPKHPQTGYDVFVKSLCSQIGAALEIPRDILLKEFNASYSASRGALLEAWKAFKTYRQWFADDFCNPVYELWMSEAVASGRVKAPGFFTNPLIREAWLKVQWTGPSQGQLDPVKEVTAEIMACEAGYSTREDSALRINGSDFDSNIRRLSREIEAMEKIGLVKEEADEAEEAGEAKQSNGSQADSKDGGQLSRDNRLTRLGNHDGKRSSREYSSGRLAKDVIRDCVREAIRGYGDF